MATPEAGRRPVLGLAGRGCRDVRGGGTNRDVLIGRVPPLLLRSELFAIQALLGTLVMVAAEMGLAAPARSGAADDSRPARGRSDSDGS